MSATTADTPQVLLEHHLKALRLPTMLREYRGPQRQVFVAGVGVRQAGTHLRGGED
jgi:hypothetical protein